MGSAAHQPDPRTAQIMLMSPEAKRAMKRTRDESVSPRDFLDKIEAKLKRTIAIASQRDNVADPFDELEIRPSAEEAYHHLNPFEEKMRDTFDENERKKDPLVHLEQFRVSNKCSRCPNPLCKVVATDDGNGGCGSLCGVGGQVEPSKDGSKRLVGKAEDQGGGERRDKYDQQVAFDAEEAWSRVHVDERSCRTNDLAVVDRAQLRFGQCQPHLIELSSGIENPHVFSLSPDEKSTAMTHVRAAVVQWAREGADTAEATGSAIFWSCVITRHIVSLRHGGFGAATPELAAQLSMDSLAERVGHLSGFTVKTQEGDAAVTKGGGKDARVANNIKYRKMCVYSLGNTQAARTAKTAYLNQLLLRAGVLKGRGFCDAVRQNADAPVLGTDKAQRRAIGKPPEPVCRIITGLNTHRGLTPPPPPRLLPLRLLPPPPTDSPPPSAPPSPAPEDDSFVDGEVSP
jgi:hypothetical protein